MANKKMSRDFLLTFMFMELVCEFFIIMGVENSVS
jgi:hypothetical protein